jgi:superfamily II DNA/RNA helicase
MQNFSELNLNQSLMQSITRMQFKIPTPIQAQAIPPALLGKDVLGTAQTGTGKTLCYGIACLNKLLTDKSSGALIVCPTRELAVQVGEVLTGLIESRMNIKSATLIGGESMQKQLRQLKKRPRLIIGTPGRLNDHLQRKSLRLNETYFLVLDETDRMLDMGFTPQIEQILKFIPKRHQTLLFSATLPQNIIRIAERYLNEPARIRVGSTTTPITKIKQEIIQVSEGGKYNELLNQLHNRKGSILLFVKTKRNADKMVDRLRDDGHSCDCMHGNLRQSKRQRTLIAFRAEKIRILVSTELAARGLDVPSIQHVINYHLPQVPEDFIHRIGRTARAGAEGCALTFITPNDRQMWNEIQRLINPNAKQEFNTFKKSHQRGKKRFGFKPERFNNDQPRGKKRFSRFKQRGNNENKSFKESYFEHSKNYNQKEKKRFGFKPERFNNDQSRGKKRFGFKSERFNNDKSERFNNDQPRGKKRFGFKPERFNNDQPGRKKRFGFKSNGAKNENRKKSKHSFGFKKQRHNRRGKNRSF